jgi:hypothetical protein
MKTREIDIFPSVMKTKQVYLCLRNSIDINAIIANIMNMKKISLAIPAATIKTPVYPTIAAMIAMTRNINAQVNIAFSPLYKIP